MKKSLISCLTAMMLICLMCAGGLAVNKDSLQVQDLYNYMDDRLDFDGIKTNDEGMQLRKFSGDADEKKYIDQYVKDITSGGYNFELVDEYFEDYGSDEFFSYALDYTGSGRVINRSEMNFKDDVYGHLTIYGVIDGSRMKGYIYIGKGLKFDDLGLRCDGSMAVVDNQKTVDFKKEKDAYVIDGGRIRVGMNEAVVLRDGKAYTCEAALIRNETKNREELHISNYYRNESIILTMPYNSIIAGDAFNKRQIGLQKDGGYDQHMKSMDDFLDWNFSDRILGVCHNSEYMVCYQDDHNDFESAFVSVLEWDTSEKTAVIHLSMTFKTEPYEVEAVAAVKMEGEPVGEDADGVYSLKVGDRAKIDCGLSHFGASYNLYKWEIVSGHSLLELDGDISKTCSITAKKEGMARLRVTYEYGAEGKDVLTGRKITDHKSKTAEYVIVIAGK